ncbi:MAG: TIGR01906 family membrane protein [Anaerolineales bacterium]
MSDPLRWPERILRFLVPPILVLTSVRLFLTHAFLEVEYNRPGFPPDSYGFTTDDRLRLGAVALDYLFEPTPGDTLVELTFSDGTPVFKGEEVRHMEDVRRLTQAVLKVWVGSIAVGLAGSVWVVRRKGWRAWAQAAHDGARATLAIVIGLGLFIAVGFPVFFTGFHRIFFQGDTWLFAYSDSLIRLFPLQFWSDVSIGIAVVALLGGGLAYVGTRFALRRTLELNRGAQS